MCDPLGKNPILGHSQRLKKGVVNHASLRKAAHWPNNNANPSWLSVKKGLLCRKSAILSIRWEFQF